MLHESTSPGHKALRCRARGSPHLQEKRWGAESQPVTPPGESAPFRSGHPDPGHLAWPEHSVLSAGPHRVRPPGPLTSRTPFPLEHALSGAGLEAARSSGQAWAPRVVLKHPGPSATEQGLLSPGARTPGTGPTHLWTELVHPGTDSACPGTGPHSQGWGPHARGWGSLWPWQLCETGQQSDRGPFDKLKM